MGRFNRLLEVLEDTLSAEDMERIRDVLRETRGLPYRRLETLVFNPSADLGAQMVHMMRTRLDHWGLDKTTHRVMRWSVGAPDATTEADWVSFVLFEGEVADWMMAEGRRDARARADEIRAFFAE